MRKELITIRDKANALLDAIDGAPKDSGLREEARNRAPHSQSSGTTGRDTVAKTEGVLGCRELFLAVSEPLLCLCLARMLACMSCDVHAHLSLVLCGIASSSSSPPTFVH